MRGFLALGDSYTIGEGVAPHERWPSQLTALLRDEGITIDEPDLIARTAWTTDELADAIAAQPPSGTYPLVTLMAGVNDQYRGRDVGAFLGSLAPLLDTAVGFAGGTPARVITVSIPDWGVTPFARDRDRAAVGRRIDEFNAAARAHAESVGAHWVDVTASSREMHAPSLVVADGLHPSGAMYARWASTLLAPARQILLAGQR